MANPLLTSALNLANYTESGIWQKNIKSGVLAQLATSDPEIKVGSTDIFTFTGTPKAELVGEGANKSSFDGTPTKVTAKTYKVQLTYRYSDEVKYADEDYQLRLVEALAGRIGKGISRALDLIAIHGVNPATGLVSENVANYFKKASNGVTVITDNGAPAAINAAAAALQGNGYNATGIALDPVFAGTLARSLDTTNRPLYPELGLGFNVASFQGIPAATSNTVSGKAEIAAGNTYTEALMGDFDAFKWGIARNVPLHLIEYGDPDGAGDLQRTNEIAIRAEAILGFAILDGDAFALINSGTASL